MRKFSIGYMEIKGRKATISESLKNLLYVLGFASMLWLNYGLFLSQTKAF